MFTGVLSYEMAVGFKGIARTQSPTNKNYALELLTFGVIVGVNLAGSAMAKPRPRGTAFLITVDLRAR